MVAARTVAEIEAVACLVRQAIGHAVTVADLARGLEVDGVTTADGDRVRVRFYRAPHLPASVRGSARVTPSGLALIALNRDVWRDVLTPDEELATAADSRFTVAHEIGHVVLHHRELAQGGTWPHAARGAPDCAETQADLFAQCLLTLPG